MKSPGAGDRVQPCFSFLLDVDLSAEMASIGRSRGLDVMSVHECGRAGLTDDAQLRLAAEDERIFVTHNRNDFLHWTKEFMRTGQAHAGVLIVSRSAIGAHPEPLACTLLDWSDRMKHLIGGHGLGPYFVDLILSTSNPVDG